MTGTPARTYAYCRVSSLTQAKNNGVDAQRAAITRWAGAQGVEVAEWFSDQGVSGKTMARPEWTRLGEVVRGGDTIVMLDLSRAGRTLAGLCRWIEDMGERKVRVVFVSDGIDLGTITGQLLAHVLGAVAEFIRKQGVEKVREGVREGMRKRGGKWGGALGGQGIKPEVHAAILAGRKGRETFGAIASRLGIHVNTCRKWAGRKV